MKTRFSLSGSRIIFSSVFMQRHSQLFQNISALSEREFRGSSEASKIAYVLKPIFRKDVLFSEKAFRNLSGKVVEQLRKSFMSVEV